MGFFVGVDWGSVEHAVCVVDERGKVVASWAVPHDAEGLSTMLGRLEKRGEPSELPIAIERPSGLLVDAFVKAGHPVVPVHPNILKATRPRYSRVGGKNDAGDAYILADVLRTDGHRFSALRPTSELMRALRTLVRGRDDLVAQRVATANQLRSLLDEFWPGAGAVFAEIDSHISMAFISKYPTPWHARRLDEKRLAAFLASHSYPGRRSPAELLEKLKAAPVAGATALDAQMKGMLVSALVTVLKALVAQIATITTTIEQQIQQSEVGRIMMSFPRAGRLCAAQIVVEMGEDRARYGSEAHLAAVAGVVPVTYESGKQRGVGFRYACNKRLRRALTCFADNSRHGSDWAAARYAAARARGCDHPHAIRILARAWVRVIWKTWETLTEYDQGRHGGRAQPLPAAS